MSKTFASISHMQIRRASTWVQVSVLVLAGLLPMLGSMRVNALTLDNRILTMDSSQGDLDPVRHQFDFDVATTDDIQEIRFQYCTTPLGACTTPTGIDFTVSDPNLDTGTDTVDGVDGGFSDGTHTANTLIITRTAANADALDEVHIEFDDAENPTLSAPYTSFYVRISTYSDAGSTLVDNGVVAGVVTQQLTVSGRVQERLEFCVAALGDADATPADCAAFPTDTTIDLGIVQEQLARSPVDTTPTNGADDDYGVAMVDTNAVDGVTIVYFPNQASSGTNQLRNFRVTGATCDGTETVVTDQCFQSAAVGGTDLSSAGERFGLQVVCVDVTQSENSTANLNNNNAAYYADNSDASCEDSDTNTTYAWNNTGSSVTLAESTSSTTKVVNDEMLKMRFGARAAATTPTGSYSVTTTFVASAQF